MRSAIIVAAALSGFAAAAPKPNPQMINIEALKDIPTPSVLGPDPTDTATPTPYDPTSAAKSAAAAIYTDPATAEKRDVLGKRTDCKVQSGGAGPVPGDGSVDAYLAADSILAQEAQKAGTPSGYVQSFSNLQGSTQQIGYLTYKNIESGKYDVDACAAFCDSVKFCVGFNIYYERDPSVDPNVAACANPAPITNVKCSVYGYPVAAESATNKGQWRGPQDANGEAFHVVIAGSNGYSKLAPCPTPATQKNFTGPSTLLHGAINAPLDNGVDTYLGMKLYTSAYDPSLCAAACQAQTAYDRATAAADGTYKPCNFFNSYILAKNNVPQGTYCSFYTRSWSDEYAVNTGYWYGTDKYEVWASFTYELTNKDAGHV